MQLYSSERQSHFVKYISILGKTLDFLFQLLYNSKAGNFPYDRSINLGSPKNSFKERMS